MRNTLRFTKKRKTRKPNSNSFSWVQAEETAFKRQVDLFVLENYKVSNMGNTKWRKLFVTLSESDLELEGCHFKFVQYDTIYRTRFPQDYDLRETMFDDFLDVRFRCYKELEWIEIPVEYKNEAGVGTVFTQNIAGAHELLKQTGQFEMTLTATGLKVFGYS